MSKSLSNECPSIRDISTFMTVTVEWGVEGGSGLELIGVLSCLFGSGTSGAAVDLRLRVFAINRGYF